MNDGKRNGNDVTPLSFVMELLGVRGSELARAIYVDRSLISKWKNGARPFHPNPKQLDHIVSHLLEINETKGVHRLEQFFNSLFDPFVLDDQHTLESYLIQWLYGYKGLPQSIHVKQTPEHLYQTTFQVFLGHHGKQQAFIEFLHTMDALSEPHHIMISDMGNPSWTEGLTDQWRNWQDICNSILRRGHSLTIIVNTGKIFPQLGYLIEDSLPYIFQKKLQLYYLIHDSQLPLPSCFLIEDVLLMYNNGTHDEYTALYRDSATLQFYRNQINARIFDEHQMMEIFDYSPQSFQQMLHMLRTKGQIKDEAYLITPLPVFSTMEESTLHKVIEYNGIALKDVEPVLQLQREIRQLFLRDVSRYFCRQIYDLNLINHLSEQTEIEYVELSTFCAQPIRVPRSLFIEHLKALLHMINEYPYFQVALVPFNELPMAKNSSTWVKQNAFLYSYPYAPTKYNRYVLSKNTLTVHDAYYFCSTIWKGLPSLYKSPSWVIQQLEKIIQSVDTPPLYLS